MSFKILIVDDEPALQNMVGEILVRAGYEIQGALSCAQALERFRTAAPEAVLLDVMLPDGDGFSLFGQLRQIRDVPVLFLSARDEDEARLRGLGLGADDYITKPFLPQELLLRLKAVLRRVYREEPSTAKLGGRRNRLGQKHRPAGRRRDGPHRQGVFSAPQALGGPGQHRHR
ncbi:MAG: response regulator transcription factor [Oscillospiraceae bacterium]